MRFSSVWKTGLAREARNGRSAKLFDILECLRRTGADGGPSARLADCARTMNLCARNRQSWMKPVVPLGNRPA